MSIIPASPHPVPAKDAPHAPLTLSTPRRRHLVHLWEALAATNDLRQYSDLFPRDGDAAKTAIARGTLRLWVVLHGAAPVGCWFVHDRGVDHNGLYGWVGCFFLPHARGRIAVRSFPLLLATLDAAGLRRLFVAVKVGNRPAMWLAARLGFRRVGVYDDFTVFGGKLAPVALYVKDAADSGPVWEAAHRRALAVRVLLQAGGGDAPAGR